MPRFNVTIKHQIEDYASLEITAKDADAAETKVQKLIETKTWEEILGDEVVESTNEVDEVTIEEVSEE